MRRINKVAVLGAGVMGTGIAAHLANAGLQVVLLDRAVTDTRGNDGAGPTINLAEKALKVALKTRPSPFFTTERSVLVTTGSFEHDLVKIAECDWVVEAVIEHPAAKTELFNRILPHLSSQAILSTNTSGLPVNLLAKNLPEEVRRRFLLTHFFNPPRYMPLLEMVPVRETDPQLFAEMAEFLAHRVGKGVVVGKDTPNFVGNRIGLFALLRAMNGMREQGMTIEEVDALCGKATCRPRSAVFRTADMVGIDTLVKVARHSFRTLTEDEQRSVYELPGYLLGMVEHEMLGDKSGGGFYRKVKGEGGTARQVLDLETLTYREPAKTDFPCLAAAKKIDDPAERLRTVLGADDAGSRFAWTTLRDTLLYAVNRIPEIADGIEQVDRAMGWGFNWELGPFEMLDAIGVPNFIRRIEEDGIEVPASLRDIDRFYRVDNGQKEARNPVCGAAYRRLSVSAGELDLTLLAAVSPPLAANREASLLDLGDGVFCLEFHSKMNSIGPELLEMLLQAVRTTEEQGVALVIGNQGQVFSAGANLGVLAMALVDRKFDEIDQVVRLFQQASMALKYARVPVVAAPFNLALGGACEFCLHSDAIVAHAETYMGLVEVGVGILPAGGGCKELALRAIVEAERLGADVASHLYRVFENIGMAKVSTSAEELFTLGYLRHGDSITMNRARLIGDAKQKALALAVNYQSPIPRTALKAPGNGLAASMKSRLWNLQQGGFISDYDRVIGSTIAEVLCGGDVAPGTPVSEERLLELEREGFLSLVGNPQTAQRIEHMLKTGKPLRN